MKKFLPTKKQLFLFVPLTLILIVATFLRFYKLGEAPPSLSWDETAVGYNAWTILHWGKDEWGNTLPLVFKSFEDYKHPVHVYLTVPSIALFGLNEVGVRASTAFFGVLNVLVTFFLAKQIFKSNWAGFVTAFFMSISPYAIHFSRFNHELNFAIFFFMLGAVLTLKGLEKKNYLLILGFGAFGVDLLTYHSAKIVTPVFLLLLIALYFKQFLSIKKIFLGGLLLFGLFAALHLIEPQLLGTARLAQTSSKDPITLNLLFDKYSKHWTNDYLFEHGDTNPRLSSQNGMFYKIDLFFVVVGMIVSTFMIVKKRKKEYLLVIFLLLIAPIPAILSDEVPHASRAMFMLPAWYLVASSGIGLVFEKIKKLPFQIAAFVFILLLIAPFAYKQFVNYYEEYSDRYAIEWQYGMKQVASYVKENPNYFKIYMTNIRQQPYIFFLFYSKTPLPEFLKTVKYDTGSQKSYNTVAKFSNFQFGGWDSVESMPSPEILYVVQPSDFTGLRFRQNFEIKELVKYPNGADAFYLVAGKKEEIL